LLVPGGNAQAPCAAAMPRGGRGGGSVLCGCAQRLRPGPLDWESDV